MNLRRPLSHRSFFGWLALLLSGHLALQLVNVFTLPLSYDEGLNLLVRRFMSLGYEPYRQVTTLTWPLFTGWLSLLDDISILGLRLCFVPFSLLLLLGTALLARRLVGELPALAAVFLLATAPTFLSEASLINDVVPGLSLALLSTLPALRYPATGRAYWPLLSGLLWGGSLLMSIQTLAVAGLSLMLLIFPPGSPSRQGLPRQWPAAGFWFVAAAGALTLGYSLAGPAVMALVERQQILRQHLELDLVLNFRVIGQFLGFNLWLTLLAMIGLAHLVDQPQHRLWLVVIWGLLSFWWLMVQLNLRLIDAAGLLPPLALIGGWGLVRGGQQLQRLVGPARGRSGLIWSGLAMVFLLVTWARFNAYYLREVDNRSSLAQLEEQPAIAEFIDQNTRAEACVIIDDPALAVLADRLPLPQLVGLSREWLAGGLMTDRQLAQMIVEGGCRAIVFSNRDVHLPFAEEFNSWIVANYPHQKAFLRTRIYHQ